MLISLIVSRLLTLAAFGTRMAPNGCTLSVCMSAWGDMAELSRVSVPIRFGPFEVSPDSGELRKNGTRLKLTGQAIQVLIALLERPGQLVTREEIQDKLWPGASFGDFEHGINAVIKRLRDVLGDSASQPKFIETIPRRGYRFVGAVASSRPEPARAPEKPEPNITRELRFVFVALLMVVCVGAIFWAARSGRSRGLARIESEVLTPVPFTALVGSEIAPTFSPDGSQIAFGWNGDTPPGSRSKGFDLYVKVIGSENLLRLTHHPSKSIDPAWSPDGQRIAFHRISGSDTGIYMVPALGGPERKLLSTHTTFVGSHISWSPDSKWIAYADSVPLGTSHRIYLLSVETLQQLPIRHAPECKEETSPAFSRLGTLIAYICNLETGRFALYSIVPPDGVSQRIGIYEGWPWGIAWRGENRLVLSRYLQGTDHDELYEVTLSNGSIRKLRSETSGDADRPATSITANKLAYMLTQHGNTNIWRKDLLHPQAAAVEVIASSRESWLPQYSPDGKYIVFGSDRGGNFEIWLSHADGSNLVRLSNLKNALTGSPKWSPDGSKIAFDSRHAGLSDVYIENVSNLAPRKLVTNVANASTPSWSHDGKWIYFIAGGTTGRIYRCPAEGGTAVPLSKGVGWGPQESFDGKAVYFAREVAGNTVLNRISPEARGAESVVEGLHVSFLTNWAVARNGIYFQPAEALDALQFFDFTSKKKSQVLTIQRGPLWGLSVSPDGRWISYSHIGEATGDIMLLENFAW
jgi:Tol biopolymer transport system component/DNA-binding winged helix-turn-helix (wHTH) protein